tara:strand:- start:901 stop:1371 length:471 start_codon:yes stop_codon:yes gene_type:complete
VLKNDFQPEQEYAYLYGNLKVEKNSSYFFAETEIALTFQRLQDGKKTYISFDSKSPLMVVKIKPDGYRLKGFSYLDHYNVISGSRNFNENIYFVAEPYTLYYIGDYDGYAGWTRGYMSESWNFEVKSMKDNYIITTSNFLSRFPKFRTLNSVNIFK